MKCIKVKILSFVSVEQYVTSNENTRKIGNRDLAQPLFTQSPISQVILTLYHKERFIDLPEKGNKNNVADGIPRRLKGDLLEVKPRARREKWGTDKTLKNIFVATVEWYNFKSDDLGVYET